MLLRSARHRIQMEEIAHVATLLDMTRQSATHLRGSAACCAAVDVKASREGGRVSHCATPVIRLEVQHRTDRRALHRGHGERDGTAGDDRAGSFAGTAGPAIGRDAGSTVDSLNNTGYSN